MRTPIWILTLLLASLQTSALRSEGDPTQCVVAPVVDGEPGKMTFFFREDINFQEDRIFAHLRRGDDAETMTCSSEDDVFAAVQCDTENRNFVTNGIINNTLELHILQVSRNIAGIYVMKIYVNDTLEPRIYCDFEFKEENETITGTEESETNTTAIILPILAGLIIVGMCVGVFCWYRRRNSRKDKTQEQGDVETGENETTATHIGDGDTTKAPEAEGERDALLSNDPSDSTSALPPSPQPDTVVSSSPQGLGDGDTTKEPEAEGETTALLSNDASDPTPPQNAPSPHPDTGVSSPPQGLREEGDADDTSKASESEGEIAAVFNKDASDPTPPQDAPSPQPEFSVSSPPRDDENARALGTALRVLADDVSNSQAQQSIVESTNSSVDKLPESLLADSGTLETVIALTNWLRSSATKFKKEIHQTGTQDIEVFRDVFKSVQEKAQFLEQNPTWEALRGEIARRANLQLSTAELEKKAKLLVKGALDKDQLVSELSEKFEAFCQDTSCRSVDTNKTFAGSRKYTDFNVVCLCLTLRDIVEISVRMQAKKNPGANNVLARVATELEGQTRGFRKHGVSVW